MKFQWTMFLHYRSSNLDREQITEMLVEISSLQVFEEIKSAPFIDTFVPLQLHPQIAIWNLTLCLGVL